MMSFSKTTPGVRLSLIFGAWMLIALPSGAGTGTGCETLYALTDDASYVEGCFPPCECPLQEATRFRGTMTMGPPTTDFSIVSRAVSNLYWIVTIDAAEVEIIGSGVYRRSEGPSPAAHALDLDLTVDGGEPQPFRSGWLPLDSDDTSINITISINGQTCHDTVIVVDASPVPPETVLQYTLASDSTYQQGCFDLCECPLEEARPLEGTMSLVPILDHGTYIEYAVPHAAFVAPTLVPGGNDVTLDGFGLYTLIQGFAGPAHILQLRLQSGDGGVEVFDNDLFNTDSTFPGEFEVVVDANDRICFDTVLSLHAIWSGPIVFSDGFECGNTSEWWSTP